jgi:hypothetical protein
MATITINRLTTSNTTPTLTGTVEFNRIVKVNDKVTKTQTINVIINYNKYKLFDGNLGLDESKTPNVWKLHFDSPLYPGTYDVEAQVIDNQTNMVIASVTTQNAITITRPTMSTGTTGSSNMNILQKLALVQSLMNDIGKLFGGQNGIGDNPSVHPAQDDQISSNLAMRGAQERNEHPTVAKDKDNRQKKMTVPYPVPRPDEFKSTKPGSGAGQPAPENDTEADYLKYPDTGYPPDTTETDKISETEKILAEAQAKTDAINQTFDSDLASNGGDLTKTIIEQNPGDTNVTPSSVLG